MERPRSIIGSVTSYMPSHRRNASTVKSPSKLQPPPASSVIEKLQPVGQRLGIAQALGSKEKETIQLFIANLRLLKLHNLPDWPNITSNSFSSHDSRTRMRCTEWSLYQVFRIYDHHMTADKLQPFFPPLEPLQSVNLRAALHRCLNELKKNGVLGRETILRKTMLDECSGEKFWELCLVFSANVLRKITSQSRQRYGQHVARQLASAQTLSKTNRENLLPLTIAHRSGLSTVLSRKHRRGQSYIHVFDSMKDKEDELNDRKHAIDTQPPIIESAEHAKELDMIEKEINGRWTDDRSFKDAIVNGDPAKPGDHILLQSTHEFLAGIGRDGKHDDRRDSGLLEDIAMQARVQHARVKEWHTIYARLNRGSTSRRVSKETKSVDLHFDQHHDLGIDDPQPEPVKSTTQPEPTPSYVSKYDEILTSMREELRRAHTARRIAEETHKAAIVRKPSITLDAVAGAPHLPPSRSAPRRSISPSFPLRPNMASRTSSRSKAYQQPKVTSQREHMPFKSEIFSPLSRTGSLSPASARSSLVASPLDEGTLIAIDTLVCGRASKRESQNSEHTPTIDSGIGLGVDLNDASTDGTDEVVFKRPAVLVSRSVSFAHRTSLSDRTRMSMSSPRLDDNHEEAESNPDQDSSLLSDGSLAARTRQSMAGISVPLPIRISTSYSHSRASSVAQPFMPAKHRTVVRQTSRSFSDAKSLEPGHCDDQGRRKITPIETLFQADAVYSSVFRSRPKIATSPPLTPSVDGDEVVALRTGS